MPDKRTTLPVMVEDLCILGCLLEYAPSLQVQQDCELIVDWEGRQFRTPALVAWISQQGQVGLAFHNSDAANHQLLREICAELRMKPPSPLPQDTE